MSENGEEEGKTATNLQVIQRLAEQIGTQVCDALPPGDTTSVVVTVYQKETAWFLAESIVRGIGRSGRRVTSSQAAGYSIECGALGIKVAYSNLRRDGIFGGKMVDRTVSLLMNAKLADHRSGNILLSGDVQREASDIVSVSEIDAVENPAIPLTRGKLPAEGFFSTLAEPLIVLGAIAVAMYLLFSVRS